MLRCIFCVLASYVVFSFVVAFGQDSKPEPRKKIVYKEKSYYDFEGSLIKGDTPGQDSSVFRKDRTKFKSSLNLSRSFEEELKSSAQEAY